MAALFGNEKQFLLAAVLDYRKGLSNDRFHREHFRQPRFRQQERLTRAGRFDD